MNERNIAADAVECRDVTYRFGGVTALDGISCRLRTGITMMLGSNGSGKTTFMRLLATMIRPQHGDIRYGPLDYGTVRGREGIRAKLGYLPQHVEFSDWESVQRNVEYAAWARGVSAGGCAGVARHMLREVGLSDVAQQRVRGLSGGMRQRLGLACAMVHDPRLLILDEPTVGLDPVQCMLFRRLVAQRAQDTTVLMSTHMVNELQSLDAHVMVLSHGSLVFDAGYDDFVSAGLRFMRSDHDTEDSRPWESEDDTERPDGHPQWGTPLEYAYWAVTADTSRGRAWAE